MRKFEGCIATNKVGSGCHFEFEVDDDATLEEIEEIARETAFQEIEWWFDEVTAETAK